MRIVGIVCEYNPFHNGHRYHIEETRRAACCDAVIGIMSGNYVQRGEPALFEKRLRARCAVQNGMDLVLELPALHTLQSAERFAHSAVTILNSLGLVDVLSFGAEETEISRLAAVAELLAFETEPFKAAFKAASASGRSYPAAREDAVRAVLGGGCAQVLSEPNNILGVEYLKALLRLNSGIQPFMVSRLGAGHDTPRAAYGFASASQLRGYFRAQTPGAAAPYLPASCLELLRGAPQSELSRLDSAMIGTLCAMSAERLAEIADVTEGLENKIKKSAMEADTIEDLIARIKSKRYTHSRLRRTVLNAYLGITKRDQQLLPQYIKILDFNQTGREILNRAKKSASLPLAKNRNQIKGDPISEEIWDRELLFDRLYRLTQDRQSS